LRTVLDPDKAYDREHFVVGDKDTIRLDVERVAVDVERFLAAAGSAQDGDGLELAESLYTGDFLEEDAYEEWAAPLRENARAAYIDAARTLAEQGRAAGDAGAATKFFLRVLERDPYDEQAHLALVAALVAAGRHGEAQRFYRSYADAMEQIGIEAAPFGQPLSRP
jgi:DNA-binding SARP family transcriptional activator